MRAILLLENGVILASALGALRGRCCLLTAKYDLLEEKYMIFSVDVRLGDGEDIIQEKGPEIG